MIWRFQKARFNKINKASRPVKLKTQIQYSICFMISNAGINAASNMRLVLTFPLRFRNRWSLVASWTVASVSA